MSPYDWNPDSTLQISKKEREGEGMFCVGYAESKFNARCRWSIPGPKYSKICSILEAMGRRPPDTEDVVGDLRYIAELGVCSYHGHEVDEIVRDWMKIIRRGPVKDYRRYRELQKKNKSLGTQRQRCFKLLLGEEAEEMETDKLDLYNILTSRIDQQQAESKTANKLSVTKRELKDVRAENRTLLESIENLEAKLMESEEQREMVNEAAKGMIGTLHSQLNTTKGELSDLLQQIEKSVAAYQQLNSERMARENQLIKELTHAQNEVEEQRKERCRINEELREAQRLVGTLQEKAAELTAQFTKITKELQESKTRNVDLLSTNARLQGEATEIQRTISESREANESLSAQVASTLQALQKSQTELQEGHEAKIAIENSLRAKTAELAQLRARMTEMEERQSASAFEKLERWISTKWGISSNLFKQWWKKLFHRQMNGIGDMEMPSLA